MASWYSTLQKPPLTPPNWIFGPVWTVIYIMMVVSAVLIIKENKKLPGSWVYILMAAHLVTNLLWTTFFFGIHSPPLALIDILILDATLVWCISIFWRVSMPAVLLLLPYLAWVLFATYLNIGFVWLGRGAS